MFEFIVLVLAAFLSVENEIVRPNDLIEVRITDLLEPDHTLKSIECVDGEGFVRLPALRPVAIANKSPAVAADVLAEAYVQQQIVRDAKVHIRITRAAAEHELISPLRPGDELEIWTWDARNSAGTRHHAIVEPDGAIELADLRIQRIGDGTAFDAEQAAESMMRKANKQPTLVSIRRVGLAD